MGRSSREILTDGSELGSNVGLEAGDEAGDGLERAVLLLDDGGREGRAQGEGSSNDTGELHFDCVGRLLIL